jgi:hypothetical protein
MNFRGISDLPTFEIVTLDDTDELDPTAFDTKPLDTPTLDEQIDDLIRFGERLDAVDTEGNDNIRLPNCNLTG